jgi:hypothetical protein
MLSPVGVESHGESVPGHASGIVRSVDDPQVKTGTDARRR